MSDATAIPKENNVQRQTAAIIPFSFDKQQVRTLLIDGLPWFVAADVCASLAIANVSLAVNGRADRDSDGLDEDEKGIATVNTPSGAQEMLVVNESGLYALIFKSRKAEAKRFKKWVTAEVLPAIRKTSSYTDSRNKMATLIDDVIGVSGTNLINGVIGQKVAKLPAGIRRQAKHKLHAVLHTRFNVPRTELIPADKLDVACEYLAAYALEGEFLPKDSSQGNGLPSQLSPTQRFLVFTDHAGHQQVQPISREACVMTHREMISGMIAGDIMVSTPEMFEFLAAVTENLRLRSLNQARRAAA
ncbi:Prophage antirepressor [Pseudomonas sp. LAMO17WK12:I10]|uniref:BRO-N domain-containing protein n=1 Tax=unclassified Pseudomonas TaxID=196821 RepID=UPI000BD2C814|nr:MULTISPECIES: BRO family protein [unclassified Pseudomonas]PXX59532.1 BRO family protein [Pseudomonas sp. LAMO17WK12:I9]SNY46757.1 Prophage antirepressor [Pseudomonas sp. LAMO17WK12:I10]